jgi:hypothetical protein
LETLSAGKSVCSFAILDATPCARFNFSPDQAIDPFSGHIRTFTYDISPYLDLKLQAKIVYDHIYPGGLEERVTLEVNNVTIEGQNQVHKHLRKIGGIKRIKTEVTVADGSVLRYNGFADPYTSDPYAENKPAHIKYLITRDFV